MQCPECHYISFKTLKKCENCGFDLKGYKPVYRVASSFTIHEGAPMTVALETAAVGLEEEPQQSFAAETRHLSPSGDFDLDLSDASMEIPGTVAKPQGSNIAEIVPPLDDLDFDLDAELEMGDLEVEGLGFEDLDEGPTEPETEISLVEAEPDISLAEPESAAVSLVEPESETEIALDLEPEIATEEPLDLGLGLEENIPEPVADFDAITLDFEESPVASEAAPTASPVEDDEFEIRLELDDSNSPLSGQAVQEESILEIEDLGLELEDSEEKKEEPGEGS